MDCRRAVLSHLAFAAEGRRGIEEKEKHTGCRVVIDDDAHARASLASSELDLGSLDQRDLGVLECSVEAGEIPPGDVGSVLPRRNLLAQALEGRNLLGLGEGAR